MPETTLNRPYTLTNFCAQCRSESRLSITVDETPIRTNISVTCKRGHVHAGDIPREGPRTVENLLQDIQRAIRGGGLEYVGHLADGGIIKPPRRREL